MLIVILAFTTIFSLNIQGKQVTIKVDGKEHSLYTFKKSIQNVIRESGTAVGEEDIVTPSLVSTVKEGEVIKITRVIKRQVHEEKEIPFQVIKRPDYRLPQGWEVVKQDGIKGVKKLVYQVTLHDGIEMAKNLIQAETKRKPRPKIIAVGKRPAVPLVNRSQNKKQVFADGYFKAEATAYTFTGYRTATGITPYRGVIAVDSSIIPLGTRLYVEGYGEGVALDTGVAIKGNRIDVFFPTKQEALKWGRRVVKVKILSN
ncbi:MAG: G5 domain-containing protein [Desulfotomaculum sp.]|nr:G5 domain-containing protein [Desulfotomaculum sp.]